MSLDRLDEVFSNLFPSEANLVADGTEKKTNTNQAETDGKVVQTPQAYLQVAGEVLPKIEKLALSVNEAEVSNGSQWSINDLELL